MYLPNRNPTELYYESHKERYELRRQEARNRRWARRSLATLSTVLLAIVAFVGLAAIVVGPGRAIDWGGTYLVHAVGILGALALVVGLSMREGPRRRNEALQQTQLASLVNYQWGAEGHVGLCRRGSIRL